MNQRLMILQALREKMAVPVVSARGTRRAAARGRETADAARQEKTEAFLQMLDERRDLHWEELVREFRENYYEALPEIVPAVLATDDALIVYNCVRFADLSRPQEVEILKEFARHCDVVKHQVSLLALLEAAGAEFAPILQERGRARPREEWEEELDPTVAATLFQFD